MPRKKVKRQNRSRGWGSVGKRPAGDWYAQIPARVNPKRPTTYGFATAEDAHEWLDKAVQAWADGKELGGRRPFGEYLKQWIARREPFLAHETRITYNRAVTLMEPIYSVPLTDLTHEHLGSVYAAMRTRGLALTTIRGLRTAISAALNEAVPTLIPENPNRRARVPKPQLTITCWDVAERNRFLSAVVDSNRYALWLLALTCGPRPEELRGLKWSDVDWTARRITISRGLSDVGIEERSTKSRRERKITLHEPLYYALRELQWRGPKVEWMFANPDTGQPWNRTSMSRELRRVSREQGLKKIRLYDCRHTSATAALTMGASIADVAYMLGHADPSVTLSHYSHWLPSGQATLSRMIGETVPHVPVREPGEHENGASATPSPIPNEMTR